ncbi:MAG: phosphoserine phosphatase SerB [Halobacteriales archaeon]
MTLVAFDFDGTLSDDEMIVLLGEKAGAAAEIADVTERAMDGELSYAESLRKRAGLLAGVTEPEATDAYDGVQLRDGTADLIGALDAADVETAILTGGFEAGVGSALRRHDVSVDHVVANRLPTAEGALTGDVEGPLIEGTKDDALTALADDVDIPMAETVAVGDGANDVPMLQAAGFAVGFRPKSGVAEHCDVVVETMAELESVLAGRGVIR